jgi:Uncharacterized protein conserved in bacteria, COG3854
MDLGRLPESRYVSAEASGDLHGLARREESLVLRDTEICREDLSYVLERISNFDEDNRAGIARTLHRISAIRNRRGEVVGLTCRVGRAVYGTLQIIEDIITSGKSILLLGKPGVGKTTMLREAARVLAETRRVVIVDTSNEIGGDGDIPHPAVGRARRMQVSTPSRQHEVMIEAVENHNPQVIVIDEIGREQEAEAARTIAERGVQLIGTAHGQTIENLMANPTLNDLIGGIESVTLSDEEARRRGTQKTVLERKAPPTFDVLIEILDFHRLAVHHDVAQTVDRMLRGNPPRPEIRVQTDSGGFEVVQRSDLLPRAPQIELPAHEDGYEPVPTRATAIVGGGERRGTPSRVFPYGVSRSRLEKALRDLHIPAYVARDVSDADALVVLHSTYQRRPPKVREAMQRNLPIAVVRSNTYAQLVSALRDLFHKPQNGESAEERALREAEEGVEYVLQTAEPYELSPQNSYLRRLQHQLIEKYRLLSESVGEEPNRRVRILPIYTDTERED